MSAQTACRRRLQKLMKGKRPKTGESNNRPEKGVKDGRREESRDRQEGAATLAKGVAHTGKSGRSTGMRR